MPNFRSGFGLKQASVLLLTAITLASCQAQPTANRQGEGSLLRSANFSGMQLDGEGDILRQGAKDFQAAAKQGLAVQMGSLMLNPGLQQGQLDSAVLNAPFDFDALMPAWEATGDVQLLLRVSGDGRQWGEWLPLMPERNMLLPQRARFVQYRVILRAGKGLPQLNGLTLSFGRKRQMRPALARRHPIAKPRVVSREGWQAAPPKSEYTPHQPIGIVVHHTWVPKAAQYQGAASVRGIQRYHMVDNKWSDIGYHYVIGPEGVIYQGRPETVIGAHSVPNTGMIGICVYGDYDPKQDVFTDASRAALLDLMTWLTAEYGINTNEFYGHRDFANKSCPGEEIYKHLQAFKDEVLKRLTDAGVLPAPSPAP